MSVAVRPCRAIWELSHGDSALSEEATDPWSGVLRRSLVSVSVNVHRLVAPELGDVATECGH